jgi:hypothetical protein
LKIKKFLKIWQIWVFFWIGEKSFL